MSNQSELEREAMLSAIVEHLGPRALTNGKMSVYDAFCLGWVSRSDLALPDGLKAELIRALNFGRAAHMYAASQFCDSDAVELFNERLSLIESAIERLNEVKS